MGTEPIQYKMVLMAIKVPAGQFCWGGANMQICGNFDNEFGAPTCTLGMDEEQSLKYGEDMSVLKPPRCIALRNQGTPLGKELFQVLNKFGNPASNDFDDLCIFPTREKAQGWIDYLADEIEVDEPETLEIVIWHVGEMFTMKDVEKNADKCPHDGEYCWHFVQGNTTGCDKCSRNHTDEKEV